MNHRRGLSLVELLATVVILGIVASAGIALMRLESAGNHGAQTTANTLAMDLQYARRQAITTGDEHYLALNYTGSYITSYVVTRNGVGAIDSVRTIPEDVQLTIDPEAKQAPSFTFEGQATSSYDFNLQASGLKQQVSVIATTGRATVN